MNWLLLEHKRSYDNIHICCCYENNHDALMSVFYFIENQQTIISVIEAIAIYHNIRKSHYKSFSASPHTQLSFSLSQLLTLTQYLWVWSFNRTQRKIGAYSFASQPFTSRVMSTIIVHENSHPISYIYISGSFQHIVLAKG